METCLKQTRAPETCCWMLLPGSGYTQTGISVLRPELQCFISDYQLTRDAALHHGPQGWTRKSTGEKHSDIANRAQPVNLDNMFITGPEQHVHHTKVIDLRS